MATSNHLSRARQRAERLLDVLDPEKRPQYDRAAPEKKPDPILALAIQSILDAIEDAFSALVLEAREREETYELDVERLRAVFLEHGWSIHIGDEGAMLSADWSELREAYEDLERPES